MHKVCLPDAYWEYQQAFAWLPSIATLFEPFDQVMKIMCEKSALDGFDLEKELTVVSVCRNGKQLARAALRFRRIHGHHADQGPPAQGVAAIL